MSHDARRGEAPLQSRAPACSSKRDPPGTIQPHPDALPQFLPLFRFTRFGCLEALLRARTVSDSVTSCYPTLVGNCTAVPASQVKQQAFKQFKLAEAASSPHISANGITISPVTAPTNAVVKQEQSPRSFSAPSPSRSSGTLQSTCGFASQAAAPSTLPRPPSTSDNSGAHLPSFHICQHHCFGLEARSFHPGLTVAIQKACGIWNLPFSHQVPVLIAYFAYRLDLYPPE